MSDQGIEDRKGFEYAVKGKAQITEAAGTQV